MEWEPVEPFFTILSVDPGILTLGVTIQRLFYVSGKREIRFHRTFNLIKGEKCSCKTFRRRHLHNWYNVLRRKLRDVWQDVKEEYFSVYPNCNSNSEGSLLVLEENDLPLTKDIPSIFFMMVFSDTNYNPLFPTPSLQVFHMKPVEAYNILRDRKNKTTLNSNQKKAYMRSLVSNRYPITPNYTQHEIDSLFNVEAIFHSPLWRELIGL